MRFGSLEFGVAVPNRADPWTRMCYAADDRPIAPIDDPGQMFDKLYGGAQDRENVASVLDHVYDDLNRISKSLSREDRALLEEHMQHVRQLEKDIAAVSSPEQAAAIDTQIGVLLDNDVFTESKAIQLDAKLGQRVATIASANSGAEDIQRES